jgi:hypothetical protein
MGQLQKQKEEAPRPLLRQAQDRLLEKGEKINHPQPLLEKEGSYLCKAFLRKRGAGVTLGE